MAGTKYTFNCNFKFQLRQQRYHREEEFPGLALMSLGGGEAEATAINNMVFHPALWLIRGFHQGSGDTAICLRLVGHFPGD